MKQKRTILIVDDEQPTIDSIEILLGDSCRLFVARSGEEALRCIRSESVDLVFLDITLPGMDGFETLKEIKQYDESIEVIMLTADERARTAMCTMELGAFHYITKPYDSNELLLIAQRVFEKKSMAEEIVSLRDEVERLDVFHNIVGQDSKMRDIFSFITKVAMTDSTVLITGESGTGKELVARAIHLQSSRKAKYFKAINCAAIPDHLLESELFGHEKGAFTGANERKIGKFEMANEGSLFLDEISAMKEDLQVKLLRVLQEREIERVGGLKSIPIDVRIIAATNANLKRAVESGRFREDLYYRINVIHLHLPPLRDRKDDVILLAEHFLRFFAKKFNKSLQGFTEDAKQAFRNYSWPGNVRELRNVVERAAVLSEGGLIGKENLPIQLAIPPVDLPSFEDSYSLREILEVYEKKVILSFLERTAGNQTKAAELLGIHRNTLIGKLSDFKISTKQFKEAEAASL